MRRIRNQNLAQLLMQLRFSPRKQCRKQLASAEKLLADITDDAEYPFEFICYRITGFRPKSLSGQELIKGNQLAGDLQIFIAKLSGWLSDSAEQQPQKVYTIDQLAETLGVSTKTINRWRRRGLAARKFVFADGSKRLGIPQSNIDKFLSANPKLIKDAKNFNRLTKNEKHRIIRRARTLAADGKTSRHQIINKIAARLARSPGSVRSVIINYEKTHPQKPLFAHSTAALSPAQVHKLFESYKQGCGIVELSRQFDRSRSSVYRLIDVGRARQLLAKKIEYVPSDEFLETNAKKNIPPVVIQSPEAEKAVEPFKLTSKTLPTYLQKLKDLPHLTREREVQLFRRYNFLKYLASKNKTDIKPIRASGAKLTEIEHCLAEAETIKKLIIEANLQLVVTIANKHTTRGANLLDLISDGNFSLFRAVEKFDYTRGFRFATYASLAIAKDFARIIPAEAARPDKAPTPSYEDAHRDFRAAATAGVAAIEGAHRNLVQVIKENLDQREQYIIINHFGLVGTLVKKNKKTLKQIGDDLSLSKERVRQIELLALQKLKRSLSIEEFELLTG